MDKALAAQVPSALQKALPGHFEAAFQKVILPGFEAACQTMFKEVRDPGLQADELAALCMRGVPVLLHLIWLSLMALSSALGCRCKAPLQTAWQSTCRPPQERMRQCPAACRRRCRKSLPLQRPWVLTCQPRCSSYQSLPQVRACYAQCLVLRGRCVILLQSAQPTWYGGGATCRSCLQAHVCIAQLQLLCRGASSAACRSEACHHGVRGSAAVRPQLIG